MRKLLLSLVVAVLCVACVNEPTDTAAEISVGDTLPAFAVTRSDGAVITPSVLRGGKSLIVFFNTACKDCRAELPVLQAFYEKHRDSVQVLCISREQGAVSVGEYWQTNALTLPYAAQEDRRVYNLFAQRIIPRIYFVDAQGVIRQIYTDNPLATLEHLEEAIRSGRSA